MIRTHSTFVNHSLFFCFGGASANSVMKLITSRIEETAPGIKTTAGFPSQYSPCIIIAMMIKRITMPKNFKGLGAEYRTRAQITSR